MYIKHLEIVGFKSFADKTKISFSSGINTIVGPNGCGKSNVVDAIRWVLGEQKYSALRGKSTEEIIFAGTVHRKGSPTAQVTLVFDNTLGKIPVKNDEVTITRRVGRDGIGQYFLNGKLVRLRDVHELVADTGVGSGALFVLSQQEVDRVLSTNSMERRAMLEETAGIKKYQIRKKETLQRLEKTRQNISRLNDILQEIKGEMALYEKQISALKRYKRVKENLIKTEVALILQDIANAKEKQSSILNSIDVLEKRKAALQSTLVELNGKISSLEREMEKHKRDLDLARTNYEAVSIDEEKLKGREGIIEERISQIQSHIREYNEDINQIKKRIDDAKREKEELFLALSQKEEDLEKESKHFQCFLDEYNEYHKKCIHIKEKLDALYSHLKSLEKKEKSYSSQRDKVVSKLYLRQSQIKDKEAQINAQKSKLEKDKQELDECKRSIVRIEGERDNCVKSMESTSNKIKDVDKVLLSIRLKKEKLEEKIRQLRSEIALLTYEEENYRGFSTAFQAIMKRKESLPPLIPIHEIISIPEKFEVAIDVTLGRDFQSIITPTKADAQVCIQILKKERLGRLTFYPLDIKRSPKRLPSPPPVSGVLGWAREIISVDDKYRDIIDSICGSTLIVQDLPSAYKVYDYMRVKGFIPKMVTLEGDVLEFSGAVTGGRYKVDRSHILSRSRKIKEKEEKLREILDEYKKMVDEKAQAEKEKELLHKELLRLKREKEKMDGLFHKTKTSMSVLERSIRSEEKNLSKLKVDLEKLSQSVLELENEVEEKEKELSHILGEMQKQQEETERIEKENREDLQRLENVKKNMEDKQRTLNLIKGEISLLKSKIASRDSYIKEKSKDLDTLLKKVDEKKKEEESLRITLQELKNKKSILSLKIKSLKRVLDESFQSVKRFEGEITKLREKIFSVENEKAKIVSEITKKQLEKVEVDSHLKYMHGRLMEFPEAYHHVKLKDTSRQKLLSRIEKLKGRLSSFQDVNFAAEEEYKRHKMRYDDLKGQIEDLQKASKNLREIIREMDSASLKALEETLYNLNQVFSHLFKRVFGGGDAEIFFTNPDSKLESGIDIKVKPPGKRTTNMALLSSGEKSLTAVTFLFSLLSIKPSPFVILDELDAPLDESNVEKVGGLISEFSKKSQFIVVTHNKKTMEYSDNLIGVTMEEPGVSRVVSVKFEDVEKLMEKNVK